MHAFLVRAGLRFDTAEDEARFVQHFTLGGLGWTQSAMVFGAFVYCVFAIWDRVLDPVMWVTTLSIRVGVAGLVLLPLTAVLSFRPARAWAEAIYLVYCVVPGCMLSVIYIELQSGFDHATAGLIIVILFVSTLLPLRVFSLVAFCICTWACFAVSEALTSRAREGLRFINHFEIGVAYALSLYAVGAREIQARRQFRTSQALHDEKMRSEASLVELKRTQVQLVQAEKLASLGQLVAGVAHEVSTPLGLVLTTSTVLDNDLKALVATVESGQIRRSELTQSIARLREGVRLLLANVLRSTELVHSFRQVATDEANNERRTFDMRQWALEVLSTLQPLLHRHGHEVRFSCADGIVVETYPGALAQVIRTLALNAAVHGYADGQAGIISLTIATIDDDRLQIVFADDGIGIAPDHRSKVFDPFFTTRRDKGSAGLGLHIVFNLVVSTLRGDITLASTPGAGARFEIDLPRIVDQAVTDDAA